MKKLFLVIVICFLWPQLSYAQIRLGNDTILAFATVEEGKQILAVQDDFVRRMSPFDRAARMKTDKDVSEKEYLKFAGDNVLEWTNAEQQKITTSFQGIRIGLEALSLPFPKKVFFVKTTGDEEGGAGYTRSNAIVLPEDYLWGPIAQIQKTICHELFHIMTRVNPDLREKLYLSIGFVKCNDISFPPNLKSRKITNPDAPMNDHYIRLKVGSNDCLAIPILFSSEEKYNLARGGEFFNYLQLQFLLVEKNVNSIDVTPIYDGQNPTFLDMRKAYGFFEQVGRNTEYIIHPEEILADNFAFLVLGKKNLPSPEIITKMEKILKEYRTTEPLNSADAIGRAAD